MRQVKPNAYVRIRQNRAVFNDGSIVHFCVALHVAASRDQALIGDLARPTDIHRSNQARSTLHFSSMSQPDPRPDFRALRAEMAAGSKAIGNELSQIPGALQPVY